MSDTDIDTVGPLARDGLHRSGFDLEVSDAGSDPQHVRYGQIDTLGPTACDVRTVAVTVERTPFVVLDEGDGIVGVSQGAASQFGPQVGSLLWECYPGSEALSKPYYDRARRSGETVDFVQFYGGNVARIAAVPEDDGRLGLPPPRAGSGSPTSTR